LDSELLAEVYLELIGGRQPDFVLAAANMQSGNRATQTTRVAARPAPLPSRLTYEESQAHQAFTAKMGEAAVWLKRQ
jgi:DNA polymerase-3 subunit epsilon